MVIYLLLTAIGLVLWLTQMHGVVREIRQNWSSTVPIERYRVMDGTAVERGFLEWMEGMDLPDVEF